MTAQPYIKTNYPHHEGIWGWQDHADHVILVVRNIRQTIDEYHDILADIDYAKTWEEATEKIPNLYNGYIDMDNYAGWRDERVMDEVRGFRQKTYQCLARFLILSTFSYPLLHLILLSHPDWMVRLGH